MSDPIAVEDYPRRDADLRAFLDALGIPGIVDLHVHVLPDRLQAAVWRFFDALDDPPWPITYRQAEPTRRTILRELGVVAHTALAYAHRDGMAATLNDHTLALADADPQVLPTFTFHAEPEAPGYVEAALARGGVVAKAHLQVGRFHATDPVLDDVWAQLAAVQVPVVIHASAVYGVDGGHEYCGADAVRALLDRHPDVLLVVAHLGAPDFEDFLDLAEAAPTLWLDTAMVLTDPPFIGRYPPGQLDRLRGLLDRVVFGSDFPTIPHPYVAQVRGLAELGVDADGLRALLHDQPRTLLSRRR